jgi:hypothetical protein
MLAEPIELIKEAVRFSAEAPKAVPLVSKIFTKESAEKQLSDSKC